MLWTARGTDAFETHPSARGGRSCSLSGHVVPQGRWPRSRRLEWAGELVHTSAGVIVVVKKSVVCDIDQDCASSGVPKAMRADVHSIRRVRVLV